MTAMGDPAEDNIRQWLEEARQDFAGIEVHPDEDAEYDRWSKDWAEDLLNFGQGLMKDGITRAVNGLEE